MQSNSATDKYNIVTDENDSYIIEGNLILMQNKADAKLVYLPISAVFGTNEDIEEDRQEDMEEESEQQNDSTIEEAEKHVTPESIDYSLDMPGRRMWTYEETKALIASVDCYKDNLHHAVKRKYVWQHISHDLVSQRIIMAPEVCKKKWLNLVKTYKNSKENKNKTGRGPTRFMFYQEMDEILGTAPHICSPHSIDVSTLETACSSQSTQSSEQKELQVEDETQKDETQKDETQKDETEVQVQETEKNKDEGLDKEPKKKKKKTAVMKLREEVGVLIKKTSEKRELSERKLNILEKKLKLDERKVIALEKIAGIKSDSEKQ